MTLTWVSRIPALGDEAAWSGKTDLVAVCLGLVHVPWASYNLSDIIRINMKLLNYSIPNDNKIITEMSYYMNCWHGGLINISCCSEIQIELSGFERWSGSLCHVLEQDT